MLKPVKRPLDAPSIRTELPGPRAKALIELDRQFVSPSYTRYYPLVVQSGRGATIEDVDGNRFLDFTAGIAVCSTGHCHPRVVRAIQQQSEKLLHMSGTDFYYEPQIKLAQKLAQIAPGSSPKRVFFTNSGTESIEAAIKLARYHTRRPHIIAFQGAFHGRTMGALSLTASKAVQRRGFGPFLPGVTHVPFPNPARDNAKKTRDDGGQECVDYIESQVLRRTVAPDEVAAIFVETIQGEGGYVVPPPDFHRRLKELSQKHGMLYVVDEVQSGMGRSGKMFAIEHFGVEPDVVCTAKGIASGLPLGAMIARSELMTWPPGAHASTFGGNPVACAAALETIALLEEELMENAARQGEFLIRRLRVMQEKLPSIGDVRGMGLMIGVELVRDRDSRQPDGKLRDAVVQSAFRRGLLLLGCGESTLRLCPPLVLDRREAEKGLEILEQAIGEASL
ncbi:MAG: acetyl ornithine aminotransferase family protein [Planctomycetia bacterium]|nr:acetyl ornithine aminotransferase family protein [Planctomycetia bacterium]